MSVAVKSVPGGKLSNHLLTNVREHSKLKVSGPFGNFTLPETVKQPVVLVAGGSGITPMLSILKTCQYNTIFFEELTEDALKVINYMEEKYPELKKVNETKAQ